MHARLGVETATNHCFSPDYDDDSSRTGRAGPSNGRQKQCSMPRSPNQCHGDFEQRASRKVELRSCRQGRVDISGWTAAHLPGGYPQRLSSTQNPVNQNGDQKSDSNQARGKSRARPVTVGVAARGRPLETTGERTPQWSLLKRRSTTLETRVNQPPGQPVLFINHQRRPLLLQKRMTQRCPRLPLSQSDVVPCRARRGPLRSLCTLRAKHQRQL